MRSYKEGGFWFKRQKRGIRVLEEIKKRFFTTCWAQV